MPAEIISRGSTPNGTRWISYRSPTESGGVAEWTRPESKVASGGEPLMLYTHGNGGTASEFRTLPAWTQLRNWILDTGVSWVESSGAGVSGWGSPRDVRIYEEAFTLAAEEIQPVKSFGNFRSMGAIVGYNLLTRSEALSGVMSGAMVNSGTADLMYRYQDRDPATLNSAWGVSNFAQFQEVASSADPMQFPVSVWSGLDMLQLVGTADTTVPPGPHGLALRARYGPVVHLDMLDVRQGGDHSTGNGSYLQVPAMIAYVRAVLGVTPPDPSESDGFRTASSASRLVDGVWRPRLINR